MMFISYFIAIPEILTGRTHGDKDGYWGEPSGDFNWCEYNYHYSDFIAEPMNVMTAVMYIIGVAFHLWFYEVALPFHLSWLIIFIFMQALGSMAFHTTLKYSAQVMDEMPLFLTTALFAATVWTRNENLAKNKGIQVVLHYLIALAHTPTHTYTHTQSYCMLCVVRQMCCVVRQLCV